MRFVSREEVASRFRGKTVAIVGSGPGVLTNEPGFIDSHDVVVRVNNFKLLPETGKKTDVHYSFYGASIRKQAFELQRDGVQLCMCKCPDSRPIHSRWHIENRKINGIDFRYIYKDRERFWFCDTYIPEEKDFVAKFNLLDEHVPTTGFAAVLDVLEFEPKSLYLTGFDFFRSRTHNVNERWSSGDPADPIGHAPKKEIEWIREHAERFTTDRVLARIIAGDQPDRVTLAEFKAKAEEAAGPGIIKKSVLNLNDGGGIFERLLGFGGYRTVLEIGTLRGVSAAWMAQFVERVITIDLKKGQLERVFTKEGDEPFDRHIFWTKMGIFNVELKLVRHDPEKMRFIRSQEFDFAFIDGAHDYNSVANDFEMVKKCGSVLFHDYDPRNPNGVLEFVRTLPKREVELMDVFAFWQRPV